MPQHLSIRNATRAATAWAASPVGRLVRVEMLVTLSCAVIAVLVLLGSGRRASRSAAFRLAVWAALMLSYPTVSYTIGLMQSACSFRNELTVTWGCFLLLLLGCADGIVAFSLNDSDQQTRTMLNQALQIVYVLFLLLSYVSSLPRQLSALLFSLWALSAVKLMLRVRSFLLAGRARVLTDDNKLIADYMLHEPDIAGAGYDAANMTGYNYVVAGETDIDDDGDDLLTKVQEGGVVTVDTVWRCEGRVLSSDDDDAGQRKDLCLSFALFKLIRRRLGGYPLHESRLSKTRDFVKLGLLSSAERMYRVIEVELGFLFDLYYARYPSPKETLVVDTSVFAAVLAASLSTLFCSTLLDYNVRRAGDSTITATTWFDIWLTRGIIIIFLILEGFQYFTLVFSDWHKVKMLCRYVQRESWQRHPIVDILLRFMCYVRLTSYWNNSIGQYNILRACLRLKNSCISRMPLPRRATDLLAQRIVTDRRTLTATVKHAIHCYLRSGGLTRIRYGECTLEQNGMLRNFSAVKAMAHGGTARGVLTWHIATTMCDLRPGEALVDADREVAVMLSDHCAYLMSSAPELLPGHHHETKLLFSGVRKSVEKRLKNCRSKDDVYGELAKLRPDMICSPDVVSAEVAETRRKIYQYDVVLPEGAELGRQVLDVMPEARVRWKVLAELWMEMLLSMAPSDNVAGHVQRLATGGELITHLWALLTHAGVVDTPVTRHQQRGGA